MDTTYVDFSGGSSGISQARAMVQSACVTCDAHGVIVASNQGVKNLFGYDAEELPGVGLKSLVRLVAVKKEDQSKVSEGSQKGYSGFRKGSAVGRSLRARQEQDVHFSKTDLWLGVLQDVISSKFVDCVQRHGDLIPALLTASRITLSGINIYVLVFEKVHANAAIFTFNIEDGIIQSYTDASHNILGMRARELCGTPLKDYLANEDKADPVIASLKKSSVPVGKGAKNVKGAPVYVELKGVGSSRHGCKLQVLSVDKEIAVVELRVESSMSPRSGSVTPSRSLDLSIGFYDILTDELGDGMCGAVTIGVHRTTGTKVAIKKLEKRILDEVALAWPPKDALLMRYLHHRNIAELYDLHEADDVHYLIMELLPGGDLLSYCMNEGPLPVERARNFFRDMLSAVDYLHRLGIVHRDLKLENCVLNSEMQVKLVDFGFATWYHERGLLQTCCGSQDYAAPELFTSTDYHGPAVDVWALGVMLFCMITSQFPFRTIADTCGVVFHLPDQYSTPSFDELILGIFDVNPDLRLQVAQIRRSMWVNDGFSEQVYRPKLSFRLTSSGPTSIGQGGASYHIIDRDRLDIIVHMEEDYGFPAEAVLASIRQDAFGQYRAMYHMLLNKGSKFSVQAETRLEDIGKLVSSLEDKAGASLHVEAVRQAFQSRARRASVVAASGWERKSSLGRPDGDLPSSHEILSLTDSALPRAAQSRSVPVVNRNISASNVGDLPPVTAAVGAYIRKISNSAVVATDAPRNQDFAANDNTHDDLFL